MIKYAQAHQADGTGFIVGSDIIKDVISIKIAPT
jgi:hypothetical protein